MRELYIICDSCASLLVQVTGRRRRIMVGLIGRGSLGTLQRGTWIAGIF